MTHPAIIGKDTLIERGHNLDAVFAQIGVGINHFFGGGVYAKETLIPAGQVLVQHKHKYDHLSILASGTLVLHVDGVEMTMVGPCCLNVAAGKHHGVRTITDVVWYCIHASDEADDDALVADPSDEEGAKAIAERLAVLHD